MLSFLRHHLLWLGKTDLFTALHMSDFHTGCKFAGADTHKCDTITVCFIHICLNLKDKGRKIFRKWINDFVSGHTRKRRSGHFQKMLQKGFYTKICQGRTKEDRRKFSFSYFFQVKFVARTVQ